MRISCTKKGHAVTVHEFRGKKPPKVQRREVGGLFKKKK